MKFMWFIIYMLRKMIRTNSLKHHLEVCKKVIFGDVGQMMLDMQGKLKFVKVDNLISREMCVRLIIKRCLLFKFVEFDELTG